MIKVNKTSLFIINKSLYNKIIYNKVRDKIAKLFIIDGIKKVLEK